MRRLAGCRKAGERAQSLAKPALSVAATFLCLLLPIESFGQQAGSPTESQVKAVYLYNFGKFVRWQVNAASAGNSFDICVMGKNPFGTVLESTVAGESINGKGINVRNVAGVQEASECKILFISSSEAGRIKAILAGVRHISALTVSDIPDFNSRGGMIEFVNLQGRIRFQVNMAPMGEAGLAVSSELLKVAIKVTGAEHAGEVER